MLKAQEQIDKNLSKWFNVDKESYKLILELGKERLVDLKSEAQSITDKSIKMLTVTITLIGLFIGLTTNKSIQLDNLKWFLLFLLSLLTIGGAGFLILPKKTRALGLEPKSIIEENYDNEEDKEYLERKTYYTAIVKIQDNINYLMAEQEKRGGIYGFTVFIFCIQLAVVVYLISSTYHS